MSPVGGTKAAMLAGEDPFDIAGLEGAPRIPEFQPAFGEAARQGVDHVVDEGVQALLPPGRHRYVDAAVAMEVGMLAGIAGSDHPGVLLL